MYLYTGWHLSTNGNHLLSFDDTFIQARIVIYTYKARFKWMIDNLASNRTPAHSQMSYATWEQAQSALFRLLAAKGIV
jgi:hypothetical protein